MFSGEDIEAIVKNYRMELEPSPVEAVEDIKNHPNNILISHIMGAVAFNRGSLVEVLEDLGSVREWLKIAQDDHKPDPEAKLPELPVEYSYDGPIRLVASAIMSHSTGYFAFGDGFKGGGRMLVAVPKEYLYEYPSGLKVKYFNLASEAPANISIMDAGYSRGHDDGTADLYVRQNSLLMLTALFEVLSDTPEFAEFRGLNPAAFEYDAAGIVIAHEKGHIKLAAEGNVSPDPIENELAAEAEGMKILEENGVPLARYRLYHRLMMPPGDEKNLSRMVLDNL
jgi:hypothetical protein